MDQFIAQHADKLQGTLSCFDRVLFRGYLPFFSGYAMASFLEARKVHRRDVKRFVLTQAYRLKDHARQMAAREGRPYQYFGERTRKEDLARQLAERDGIQEGLVCVFATVEPCRTFSLRWHFEIGLLLALKEEWQKVDEIRILMGDEVSLRTRKAFEAGLATVKARLDQSLESEKTRNDFLEGVPAIVEAVRTGKIKCWVYRKEK